MYYTSNCDYCNLYFFTWQQQMDLIFEFNALISC